MMSAESTRNMYSNFTVSNEDDCLKLHHVGYLVNRVMMHGTTNIKKIIPTGLTAKHAKKLPEASDNYWTFERLAFINERSGTQVTSKDLHEFT